MSLPLPHVVAIIIYSGTWLFQAARLMASKNPQPTRRERDPSVNSWRRACGCIKTSDKLKKVLEAFPSPPPPTPIVTTTPNKSVESTCISAYCTHGHPAFFEVPVDVKNNGYNQVGVKKKLKDAQTETRSWQVVAELVSLLQLSVTATALALYYLIYCYMQLVYCTLRTALYFHNADGPMKITIGVVTLTSLIVGFNLILRMERLFGILPNN